MERAKPPRHAGTAQAFDTRGIAAAAGYTSTGEDLGRFASWQFRLLRTEKPEVLKASTLREMQRVQFTDVDWKTTRGLGFGVAREADQTYVGHGGDCPGPYVVAMFQLLDKRKAFSFKDPAPAKDVNLEGFAGRYDLQPWGSEAVIVPWAVRMVQFSNPRNRLGPLTPEGH